MTETSDQAGIGARIGNVLHPIGDVEAAVTFYEHVFGFARHFVDGDRYAALDAGGATLALVSGAEDLTGGIPAVSVKVPDVHAAVAAVVASGGQVVRSSESGPHETRAVVRDPWGNAFVVYGRR